MAKYIKLTPAKSDGTSGGPFVTHVENIASFQGVGRGENIGCACWVNFADETINRGGPMVVWGSVDNIAEAMCADGVVASVNPPSDDNSEAE